MANETKLNIFAKKSTVINNNNSACPKFSLGSVIDGKYRVEDKLSGNSGEADLYKVVSIFASNTENSKQKNVSETMVLKLYRRKDSVKGPVLESLISIRNSNVAEIIDNGNIEGFTYIVMPFYEIGSLASYIESGNLFDINAIKTVILPSIADGLKAIHSKGIIHKDIKPSNLMVSNDQNNVVLIDFGISSATEGNTVVVTQTGKSPFYSAPETTTGLFLVESDYYSLGITLYELVTGYTPYQNANIENIARYAQIQKIPYPEGFDKELADLIDGLTYKDISNRHDKSNPNRRWGYEEIQKWLRGEKQAKPGSNATQTTLKTNSSESNIPYMFKGKRIYGNKSIISTLLQNWNDGKKEVFRGMLSRHYELTDNQEALKICQKVEQLVDNKNQDDDVIFFEYMYKLEPSIIELYWKGDKFDNLQGYGKALIDEALNEAKNKGLLKTALDLLKNDVLLMYVKIHRETVNQSYEQLIQNNKYLLETAPLDENQQALRLGYALTGREDFKIGGQRFNTIQEWNDFLDKLYKDDIVNFVKFCKNNKVEIENQKRLFSGDALKAFTSKSLAESNAIVLGRGNYCFRNTKEIELYTDKLWTNKKYLEFAVFDEQCRDDLQNIAASLPVSEKNNLQNFHKNSESLFYFDELAFANAQEFIDYVQNLQALYGPLAKRFLQAHSKGIQFALSFQSKQNRQLVLEKLGIKYSLVKGNIEVGKYVKFGNYWQSNSDTKEPIEWLVLDVEKGKRALLLSKYALDCKKYHEERTNITWEHCALRKWLNAEFINNAFSEDEQNEIQLSTIINEDNPRYRTSGGNDTEDKIFLLSYSEASKYFNSKEQCMCEPTQYAVNNAAWKYAQNGMCWWWLRSPGGNRLSAACVLSDGSVNYYDVNYDNFALRVALWVNL